MTLEIDLTGERAFVTGANTGIGASIAIALARAGAHVVAVGRSAMDETLGAIEAIGGTGEALRADLGDRVAALAAFEEASGREPIGVLVNNAGLIRRADAVDFTEADWDAVMDVNLKTVFFLSQAFARKVLAEKRGGKIINIASMLSFQGGVRVASYTASKSGVAGLTRLLACEWAEQGINVNAIAPGYIATNNTEALRSDKTRNAAILGRIPAGRWGLADDIGAMAAFLASPLAAYVHGAIIPVDGGWLAR